MASQTDPQFDDVPRSKGVLNQETKSAARGREDGNRFQGAKFEGVDPDEYHKLQDRVKGLDDAEVYDKQGIEALVTRRTDAMKQEHTRQVEAKDREITQYRNQATELTARWRQDRIRTALLDAVNRNGVYDKAMDDAVSGASPSSPISDQDGQVIAKKGEDVVCGKDGINPLRPDEWITTLKTSGQAPHLWPPSSGGGAPAHRGAMARVRLAKSRLLRSA